MNQIEFLLMIISTLGGISMWFMKRTIDKQDSRLEALERTQSEIKTDYVHKTEFKDFRLELREIFQEIKQDIKELKK